tara:strand:+ start:73 stop:198 length:126 start_codon:yes stop_codon:yes gene_type:complete
MEERLLKKQKHFIKHTYGKTDKGKADMYEIDYKIKHLKQGD